MKSLCESAPSYWDNRTAQWDSMPRVVNFYLNLWDNAVRHFLSHQRGLVLDAGCGDGRFLDYADVGVDFSRGMLERAKKRGKSLVLASVLCLPFRDSVFKLAFMTTVLLHIPMVDRENARLEGSRVADCFVNFDELRLGGREYFDVIYFKLDRLGDYTHLRFVSAPLALFLSFPINLMSKLRWRLR